MNHQINYDLSHLTHSVEESNIILRQLLYAIYGYVKKDCLYAHQLQPGMFIIPTQEKIVEIKSVQTRINDDLLFKLTNECLRRPPYNTLELENNPPTFTVIHFDDFFIEVENFQRFDIFDRIEK